MQKAVIAAAQMTSGLVLEENLDTAARLVAEAGRQGAALVVLPENFAFMGRNEAERRSVAEKADDGPVQGAMAAAARDSGCWVVAGTTPILVDGDPRPANACMVYDADGRRVARYDKIHLFDVDIPGRDEAYRESDNATPGSEVVTVDTPPGRVGLSVCYDLRFPELYRRLVAAGARILSVPAAFTAVTGRMHWEILLRARAIENQCFVVASAQAGLHPNGRETHGDSMIIDHWGHVLARLPHGTGVVTATLDLAAQDEARRSFPALSHRVLP